MWKEIRESRSYQINEEGEVRSLRTARVLVLYDSNPSDKNVRLVLSVPTLKSGFKLYRKVDELVVEAFIDPDFDANCMKIVHLDGDNKNSKVGNLKVVRTDLRAGEKLGIVYKDGTSKVYRSLIDAITDPVNGFKSIKDIRTYFLDGTLKEDSSIVRLIII